MRIHYHYLFKFLGVMARAPYCGIGPLQLHPTPRLKSLVTPLHTSYFTTVLGPDILRNVIVSGYVTFHQVTKFFVKILYFQY